MKAKDIEQDLCVLPMDIFQQISPRLLGLWIWTFNWFPSSVSTKLYITHLFWGISLQEVWKDLLGFWNNLSRGHAFIEVLTGQPELNILTELWLQKNFKRCQVFWRKINNVWRKNGRPTQIIISITQIVIYFSDNVLSVRQQLILRNLCRGNKQEIKQ